MRQVQYLLFQLLLLLQISKTYDSQCQVKYCLQCDSNGQCIQCEKNYYYSFERGSCVSLCQDLYYIPETQTCTYICGKNQKEDIKTQTCESLFKCNLPQQYGQNYMGSQIIQKIYYVEDLDVLVGLFQQSQYLHVWSVQTKNLLLKINLYIGQIVNYEIVQDISPDITGFSGDSQNQTDENTKNKQIQQVKLLKNYLVAFSFQGDIVTVDLNTFQIISQDKFDIGNYTLADNNSILQAKNLQNIFLVVVSQNGRQILKQKLIGIKMSYYINFQSRVIMNSIDVNTGNSIIFTEQSIYFIQNVWDDDHLIEISHCQIYTNAIKVNAFSYQYDLGNQNQQSLVFAISMKQTANFLQIYSDQKCFQYIQFESDIISIFMQNNKGKIFITTQKEIVILEKNSTSLKYQIVYNYLLSNDSSITATFSQIEQTNQQFIIINKSDNQMDLYYIKELENQIQLFQSNVFQTSNGYQKVYFYFNKKSDKQNGGNKISYPNGIILLNSTIFYSSFNSSQQQYYNNGNTINYQIKKVLPQSNITSILYLEQKQWVVTCLQNLSMYFWTLTNNGAELICYINTPIPCLFMKANKDESHLFAANNDNSDYHFFVVQLSNFDIEFHQIQKQVNLKSFDVKYLSFLNLQQLFYEEFFIFLQVDKIIVMSYDYIKTNLIIQNEFPLEQSFYQSMMPNNTFVVCQNQKIQTIQLLYNQTVQFVLNQSLSFQSSLISCDYNPQYEKISASSSKSQVYIISQNLTIEYMFRLQLDQFTQKCLFRSSVSLVCKLYSPKESMQYQLVLIQFKENILYILYQYVQVLDILLVDNQPFSDYDDIFQVYFTKALPQGSSLNSLRVKIDGYLNFTYSYFTSQYVYDEVCVTQYYLQKEFRNIYGCQNGLTGDIFFQPQNDYPVKKKLSAQNCKSSVLFQNLFKLIIYGDNNIEIFDYRNYQSLFIFQFQPDEKIVQLLEVGYPFEYIMILTSKSLYFIQQNDKNLKIQKNIQHNGYWFQMIYCQQLQLILLSGKELSLMDLNKIQQDVQIIIQAQQNISHYCQAIERNIAYCLKQEKGQYLRQKLYQLSFEDLSVWGDQIIAVQNFKQINIIQDYYYAIEGDEVILFTISNDQIFISLKFDLPIEKYHIIDKYTAIVFTKQNLYILDIKKNQYIWTQNLAGSYMGSYLIDLIDEQNIALIIICTDNISSGLAQVINVFTGQDLGYFQQSIQDTFITDIQFDKISYLLFIKLSNGIIQQFNLKLSWFQETTYLHPIMNELQVSQLKLQKNMIVDSDFNRIILIFDTFFLAFEIDLNISRPNPYTQTPFKYYQQQVEQDLSNSQLYKNEFYLDDNNVIWIYKDDDLIDFLHFNYEVKHIEYLSIRLGNNKIKPSNFTLCLFTEKYIYFVNDKSEIELQYSLSFHTKYILKVNGTIYALNNNNYLMILSKDLTIDYYSINAVRIEYMIYIEEIDCILFEDISSKIILYNLQKNSQTYTEHGSLLSKCLNINFNQKQIYCLSIKKQLIIFNYSREENRILEKDGIIYQFNDSDIESEFKINRLSFVEYDFLNNRVFIALVNSKLINVFQLDIKYSQDKYLQSLQLNKINSILAPHSNSKNIQFVGNYLVLSTLNQLLLFDRLTYSYYDSFKVSIRYNQIVQVFVVESQLLNCIIFNSLTQIYIGIIGNKYKNFNIIYKLQLQNSRILNYQIQEVFQQNGLYVNLIYETENMVYKNSFFVYDTITYNTLYCYLDINMQDNIFKIAKNVQNIIYNQISKAYFYLQINDTFKYYNLINKQSQENNLILTQLDSNQQKLSVKQDNSKQQNSQIKNQITFSIDQFYKINVQQYMLLSLTLLLKDFQNYNRASAQFKQYLKIKDINLVGQYSSTHKAYIINQSQLNFEYFESIQVENLEIKNIILDQYNQLIPSFIKFKNNRTINIRNLKIQNCLLKKNIQSLMAFIDNNQIIIQNMQLINNTIELDDNNQNTALIYFQQQFYLEITKSQISFNKVTQFSNKTSDKQFGLLNIEGANTFYLTDTIFSDNTELIIILYKSQYIYRDILYMMKNDQVIIKRCQLEFNQISIFDKPLIQVESNSANFENTLFNNNTCAKCTQGGIYLSKEDSSVNIIKSNFTNNISIKGGSIYFSLSGGSAFVFQSLFENNTAIYSGGAIYLYVTNVQFSQTRFVGNKALIGGAIKQENLYNNDFVSYLQYKEDSLQNNSFEQNFTFLNNQALVFGNNIGLFPAIFELSLLLLTSSEETILDQRKQSFKEIFDRDLLALDSGSFIKIQLLFKDLSGQIIDFYPPNISSLQLQLLDQKVKSLDTKIELNDESNNLFLDGGLYLNLIKDYNKIDKKVQFELIQFSGNYNSCSTFTIRTELFTTIFQQQLNLNNTITKKVCFKTCSVGDIPTLLPSGKIKCSKCQQGFYNLEDYSQQIIDDKFIQNLKNNPIKCKPCPTGAKSCSENQIILKNNYWRDNQYLDTIVECNNRQIMDYYPCQAENPDSINYCVEGHIGPLCESCDVLGTTWGYPYSRNSSQSCQKCGSEFFIIFYLIVVIVIFNIYLFFSLKAFLTTYQLNSIYYYSRILKLFPISNSQYNNIAASLIKCFSNYLQISIIFDETSYELNFYQYIKSSLGSTTNSVLTAIDCLIKYLNFSNDILHIKIIATIIFPISCCLAQIILFYFVTFKNIKQMKYFKITVIIVILNFFLPSFLSQLTQSISCIKIGQKSYLLADLTIECQTSGSTYNIVNFLVKPILALLLFHPFIIFWILRRVKYKLDYVITKYKYGYYFLDFKDQYYYWEIIRVYFKLFIVIIYNLLKTNDNTYLIRKTISFSLIQIYVYFLGRYQIFRKSFIQKIDYQVGQFCSLVLLIEIINKFLNKEGIRLIAYLIQLIFGLYCMIRILNLKIQQLNRQNSPKIISFFESILPNKLFKWWFKHLNSNLYRTLILWKVIYNNRKVIVYNNIISLDKITKLCASTQKSIRGGTGTFSNNDTYNCIFSQKMISPQNQTFKNSFRNTEQNLDQSHKTLENLGKKSKFQFNRKHYQKKKTDIPVKRLFRDQQIKITKAQSQKEIQINGNL
ncbi:hypothetical protein ABPG74_015680 [Tetrahymena malaccensis]